mmetsp:Transcript_1706/g.8059  ORF Transcript_1706/g.8059 Transcript_1706/m.8059 type:complete len:340 (+) Transcript_1706:245-1264(+)
MIPEEVDDEVSPRDSIRSLSSFASRSASRARVSAAASLTFVSSNSLDASPPCAVDSLTLLAPKCMTRSPTSDEEVRKDEEASTFSIVMFEISPSFAGEGFGDATPSAVPTVAHSTVSSGVPDPSDPADALLFSDSSESIFVNAEAIESFALFPESAEAAFAAFIRPRMFPHIACDLVLTGVRLSILRLPGVDAALEAGDDATDLDSSSSDPPSSSFISNFFTCILPEWVRDGLAGVPSGVPSSLEGLASFTGDSSCDRRLPLKSPRIAFSRLASPESESFDSAFESESESNANPVRSCSRAAALTLMTSLAPDSPPSSPGATVTPALDVYDAWSASSAA